MIQNERVNLVAPCGIDCGICELYLCKDHKDLYNHLLSKGFPATKIPCKGCRNIEGYCPVIPEKCETYSCAEKEKATFCVDCTSFPCSKLMPSVDKAEILPHNMKMFNLCRIHAIGAEKFTKESVKIKATYYKGTMEIGKGPKL